jgi:hypothetical protein
MPQPAPLQAETLEGASPLAPSSESSEDFVASLNRSALELVEEALGGSNALKRSPDKVSRK